MRGQKNNPRDRTHLIRTTLLVCVGVAAVLGVVIYLLETDSREEYLEAERAEARAVAENLRQQLELGLVDHQLRARALATALELDGAIGQERFSRLAGKFAQREDKILNLALLEGTVLTLVHPFEENRHLVGSDIRDVERQYPVVERVYKTGEAEIQGPVELLQGKTGLIVRMPVKFVGDVTARGGTPRMVAVVIDAGAVLQDLSRQASSMTGQDRAFLLGLASRASDGGVVGDGAVFEKDPVVAGIAVSGTDLELAVAPPEGWGAGYVMPWPDYVAIIVIAFLAVRVFHELRGQRLARDRAQQQLELAVETLPDGFVLFDSDDRLVLCNDKYKELYGASAESMVPGARFEDILRYGLENGQYAEAVGREEEWLAERLRAHRAASTTIEQKLDDGRRIRVLEHATPDGGRVGLRIDITEQVRNRERAERAEQRLRDAINAMPAGFWLLDENDRVVMFNDMYCELYEKSAPAVKVGAHTSEVLKHALANGEYPDAVGREDEWLAELNRKFAAGRYEWEYQLQNGRWVRSYNRPTTDGGRVGIRVDVTELKQQQAELEASNEKLRKALEERDRAKARFEHVADLSKDWIWEMDADLRFTYFSEGFARNLADKPEALLGRTREEAFADKPEVWESADWKLLETKLAARAPFRDFVYRASGATEDEKWVRISGVPVFDDNGAFAGYRGVGSDISVLYDSLRKARAASLAKTEFLHVMSHELRTPLTVVLGYNAFLAQPAMLTSVKAFEAEAAAGTLTAETGMKHLENIKAEVARYAGKMGDSGNCLLNLINEMLDLAKIDSGKLKIERETICLETVIASVIDQFTNQARQKSLNLTFQTNGETVIADDLRLRQILINLVGNALKFTEEGHVAIRTESGRDTVAIHVEDSGCGIPESEQAAIFDQFSQLDGSATRAKGGTGLGLTISRRLVEVLGGKMTVESTPGAGSTFTFTLPAAKGDQSPGESSNADKAA
ncbi:sensor histidine kinase [Roseovarius salis]|uniref:sensor histidine kinase n=1 Tax=Roseovarius salis TaxID=3376063 RepID=UPI0037CB83EE